MRVIVSFAPDIRRSTAARSSAPSQAGHIEKFSNAGNTGVEQIDRCMRRFDAPFREPLSPAPVDSSERGALVEPSPLCTGITMSHDYS